MKLDDIKFLKHSESFKHIEKIPYGWSFETKYKIKTAEMQYVLRVSSKEYTAFKKAENKILKQCAEKNIPASRVVDFKVVNQKNYQLLSYIEGDTLRDVIDQFTEAEAFDLGLQAGRILKQIHSMPVHDNAYQNLTKLPAKIANRLASYKASTHCTTQDLDLIDKIMRDSTIVSTGTPVMNHGDFHVGNMIVHNKQVSIIDFNRHDVDDFAREFVPMMIFSREVSVPFVKGQLEGYFNGNIPAGFWKRLKLYLAYSAMYSVLWAEYYTQEDVEGMLRRKAMLYEDYDNFTLEVPKWLK